MWIFKHIFDGDYGYEELAPGERSKVLVTIANDAGEEESFLKSQLCFVL